MFLKPIASFALLPLMAIGAAQAESDAVPAARANLSKSHIAIQRHPNLPPALLLASIGQWLSERFKLPLTRELPKVRFASAEFLVGKRYGERARSSASSRAKALATPDVLALYDSAAHVIYLQDGWTGSSPGESSILVHEMVHHLQDKAALRYDCPAAREALAYEAQAAWLALYDRTMVQEFDLDSFSIWAHSTCLY